MDIRRRLEAISERSEPTGDGEDIRLPGLEQGAASCEAGMVSRVEPGLDGGKPLQYLLPGIQIRLMDGFDVGRSGFIALGDTQVLSDARDDFGDLPANLSLVHELGGEYVLDGTHGVRLDRGPALQTLQVGLDIDAERLRRRSASGEQECEDSEGVRRYVGARCLGDLYCHPGKPVE